MRSQMNRYCILRYNESLRTAVKFRIKSSGKTLTSIANELDIDRTRLQKYINGKGEKIITQWQLLKVCEYLNIEVSINIELK